MNEGGMDAVVKPMRRGGWSARGLIVSVRHGLLIETQVGPRQFSGRDAALEWLKQAAIERSVPLGTVVLAGDPKAV
jgi:hypothetical protein